MGTHRFWSHRQQKWISQEYPDLKYPSPGRPREENENLEFGQEESDNRFLRRLYNIAWIGGIGLLIYGFIQSHPDASFTEAVGFNKPITSLGGLCVFASAYIGFKPGNAGTRRISAMLLCGLGILLAASGN